MAYSSDTARLVLEAAARRDDLSVLPFPETVKARGGAMKKVLTGLRNRGFARVVETDGPQRVVITSEGMAAIGIADDENGTPGAGADAAPQAPVTAQEAVMGGAGGAGRGQHAPRRPPRRRLKPLRSPPGPRSAPGPSRHS